MKPYIIIDLKSCMFALVFTEDLANSLYTKMKNVNWRYFPLGTLIKMQRDIHLFLDTRNRVMINSNYLKYRFTV